MNLSAILVIILWVLFICIIGTEAGPRCNKTCTEELNPTCGTLRKSNGRIIQCTFGNPCGVRVHACQTRERKSL